MSFRLRPHLHLHRLRSVAPAVAAAALLLTVGPHGVHAEEGPRRVTLDEAVQMSLHDGLQVELADAGIQAAESRVGAARSLMFPKVHLDANLLLWSEAQEISFGMPGGPSQSITARDQLTSTITLTVAQPLSGLAVLSTLLDLERTGKAVAVADRDQARIDTAARAAEAYLRLLQARAFLGVAEKSVAQVEAHLARARVLEQGQVLDRVDVLRLEAARDQARQLVLRGQNAVAVSLGALALALNLPAGQVVDAIDELPDPPQRLPWTVDEVGKAALAQRPDVIAARTRVKQAHLGSRVARAPLYPNVLAVATATHNEGAGTFQPKNGFFVGLTLSWDLWDWGHTRNEVKEADAHALQAKLAAESTEEIVEFSAQRTALDADTAFQSVDLATSGLKAAEEAYRITAVRFEQGAATTTDLLDAETELARARSSYATARYDYYLAALGVFKAIGRMPSLAALAHPTR